MNKIRIHQIQVGRASVPNSVKFPKVCRLLSVPKWETLVYRQDDNRAPPATVVATGVFGWLSIKLFSSACCISQ